MIDCLKDTYAMFDPADVIFCCCYRAYRQSLFHSFLFADPADVNDGGFTSRTRLVMKHLQHAAAAAAGPSAAATPASGGSSRRRISAAPPPSLAAAGGKDLEQQGSVASPLSFKTLTQGHNRLDACRWFYEVLVLGNKGLVTVKQDEPYGDVAVTPNLAAMARI